MTQIVLTDTDIRKSPELSQYLVGLITMAHQYAGRTAKGETEEQQGDELAFQAKNLGLDLIEMGQALNIDELNTAFRKGLRGHYGEFYGLNNATYISWVNAFVEERKVTHKFKHKEPSSKEPTEEERTRIENECVKTVVDHFNKTGKVVDWGNEAYKILWQRGAIRFDKTQWEKYVSQAKESLLSKKRQERSDEMVKGQRLQVNKLSNEINAILKDEFDYKIEARLLALEVYLKNEQA